jgi:hypothetical protein
MSPTLAEHENLGIAREPAGDNDLLLVATREPSGLLLEACCSHVQWREALVRFGIRHRSGVWRAERSGERALNKSRVVTQRLLHEQSSRLRSSERRPMPASIAERGLRIVDRPPERAFARAFEPRYPDDLAGTHREVNVDQMIVAAPLMTSARAPGRFAARGG